MGVRVKRLPENDLTLFIVSGPHTSEEALRLFEGLDTRAATRWLTYFDPTVDMSGVDVASFPRLKRAIAAKQKELFGDRPMVRAIVCSTWDAEQFFRKFWSSYVKAGDGPPAPPALFEDLEAAFEWLALPMAARGAIAEAIESDAPTLEEVTASPGSPGRADDGRPGGS
jgi:hypothetical protein